MQHDPAMVAGSLALAGDDVAIRAEGWGSPWAHDLVRRGALGGLSLGARQGGESDFETEETCAGEGRTLIRWRCRTLGRAGVGISYSVR